MESRFWEVDMEWENWMVWAGGGGGGGQPVEAESR